MATVNVAKFKRLIRFSAEMKRDTGVNVPLFVWGKHGIGKTEVVKQEAAAIDYDCVVLNLATQSPEELLGLPYIDHTTNTTTYARPIWMKTDSKRPVIYFLDEINRAPKYVLQGMFNFVLEGRIHTHIIGKTDVVIAAGNPETEEYDVTAFNDAAFFSRFAHIYFEPTHSEVLTYFAQVKAHDAVIGVLKDNMSFMDVSVAKNERVKVTPTNRMLEKVGHILTYLKKEDFEGIGYEIISSMVGEDITPIIMNKYKETAFVDNPEDILEKGKTPKVKPTEIDRVNVLNAKIAGYIKEKYTKVKFGKVQTENLYNYLNYIPRDLAVSFLKELKIKGFDELKIIDFFKGYDRYLVELLEAKKKSVGK